MMVIAGAIFLIAFILLALVPVAALRQGREMAANGVITSLIVGAAGVPFYFVGLVTG